MIPYYRPTGDEVRLFKVAAELRLPLLLKGPTGCGKTRFVRHMAALLDRPLITVACQEDLSASDLVGRFLLEGGQTVWRDGPLTRAVRMGALCYLDEVVEARPDVLTLLHPLTDDRRLLPIDRTGEELSAPPGFLLVVSYNPGYQAAARELKESTRQRFVSLTFDYPDEAAEAEIVSAESGLARERAAPLVRLGRTTRNLRGHGLREGASTRLLIHAARLVAAGLPLEAAVEATLVASLSDDPALLRALREGLRAALP